MEKRVGNENIFCLDRNSWMDGGSTHLTLMNPGDSDLGVAEGNRRRSTGDNTLERTQEVNTRWR